VSETFNHLCGFCFLSRRSRSGIAGGERARVRERRRETGPWLAFWNVSSVCECCALRRIELVAV
jgi:hypothetical protein